MRSKYLFSFRWITWRKEQDMQQKIGRNCLLHFNRQRWKICFRIDLNPHRDKSGIKDNHILDIESCCVFYFKEGLLLHILDKLNASSSWSPIIFPRLFRLFEVKKNQRWFFFFFFWHSVLDMLMHLFVVNIILSFNTFHTFSYHLIPITN